MGNANMPCCGETLSNTKPVATTTHAPPPPPVVNNAPPPPPPEPVFQEQPLTTPVESPEDTEPNTIEPTPSDKKADRFEGLPTGPIPFGNTGAGIGCKVGYGLNSLVPIYGGNRMTDEQCFALLDHAIELGITFWDTADVYGDSEAIIGRYFKYKPESRSKVFLCTKVGGAKEAGGGAPDYIMQNVTKSLLRLNVSRIDLLYLHRPDPKTPIEKTMQAFAKLADEGKIRFAGLSEICVKTLRRAHKVFPITALQLEWSPFTKPPKDVIDLCKELDIAIVAYSPVGRGLGGGQLDAKGVGSLKDVDRTMVGQDGYEFRKTLPRFQPENLATNLQLVDSLKEIATKKGCSVAQLCLAYVMNQGDNIYPIPGTKRIQYLDDNANSVKVTLTSNDLVNIKNIGSKVVGDRADAGYLSRCGK